VFFTNKYWWECGAINDCKLKQKGCKADYTGKELSIETKTGKITASHISISGYALTICVECSNTAGSKITYDNWNSK
jgi:hypothetical protein